MRIRVSTAACVCIAAILLLSSCRPRAPEERRVEVLMGTRVEVIARGGSADLPRAVDEAFDQMRRIESLMSHYEVGSELSLINFSSGKGPVKISSEMMDILVEADKANKATGGAFDPTVGPAMKLWSADLQREPSVEELEAIREITGWRRVKLDPAEKTVQLPAGMRIDLDGIAKGYAADLALGILRLKGVEGALVDAGGDVACYSTGHNRPWKVAISDPFDPDGRPVMALEITSGAMATSGSARRFWETGGRRYPKILDPITLMPPLDPPASASAYSENAAQADAWATAAIIMGEKITVIRGETAPALAIIDARGIFIANDPWKSRFGPAASP